MNVLFRYEFRRLWAKSLPWALLLVVTALTVFLYAAAPRAIPASLTPQQLSVFVPELDRYRPAPQAIDDFQAASRLLSEAALANLEANAVILDGAGTAGLALSLLQLTQTGLLILGSLALGLAASDFQESPAARSLSSTRRLALRAGVLVASAALIFFLPRLLAVLLSQLRHGDGALATLFPFNPKAGPVLYEYSNGAYGAMSGLRLVLTQSVASFRQILLAGLVYELLQIFAWATFGLLAGRLLLRRFPLVALTALFLSLAKHLNLPLDGFPPAHFLFPMYHDALRDTLGGPELLRGVIRTENPLDYFLGLGVLFLSGVLFLYLADLQLKGRLKLRRRGGDEDEMV